VRVFPAALSFVLAAATWCLLWSPAAVANAPFVTAGPSIRVPLRERTEPVFDGRLSIELGDPGLPAQPAFIDAMKAATPWSAPGVLHTDALGNVTALTPGQIAQTVVCAGGAYPAGDYLLLYDGRGAVGIEGATVLSRLPGRITLRIAARSAGVTLELTATDPADYVRSLRLVSTAFAAAPAQTPFYPAYVAALEHVNVLRFAGWMRAGAFSATLGWESRSTPAVLTQAGPAGVAPEYMIALANATGDDPWFVFPAGVTDMYVAGFARLVHATLDPRLHPIFEYGEAMWQPGSADQRYAALAGLGAGLGLSAPVAATAWYAQRSAQIFTLVSQAYGLDGGRIRRVLAGPSALPGTAAGAFVRTLLASPAARLADAFATTDVLDPWAPTSTAVLPATAAAVARAGLALWSEHSDVDGSTNPAATRSMVDGLFAAWHAAGGGLAVTGNTGSPGKWAALADTAARYPAPHVVPQSAAWQPAIPRTIVAPASLGRGVERVAKAVGFPPGTDVLAIDCGGPAAGNWVADTDYSSPSQTDGVSGPITTRGVIDPAPQSVYETQRWNPGSFSYTIPGLTAGAAYTVRLHWAETYVTGPGQRIFNVSIDGTQVLTNFDVFATAGGSYTALVENFYATANAAGQIVITFSGIVQNPFISGIEIQVPGPIDVLDINAGGTATGNWLADIDDSGGSTLQRKFDADRNVQRRESGAAGGL
jgi:hypothetical protein